MGKMNFKVLLIAIIFSLSACSTGSIKEPEQIGKQVFEILRNLSIKSKADYVGNFLSIEEIRELGKNETIVTEEKTRNEMTSMLKEDWVGRIEGYYKYIKEKGGKYGINWQEIEYLNFVYEIETDYGIKGCRGSLYFKYKDKPYEIEVSSIFNGTEYKLEKISSLEVSHLNQNTSGEDS